MPTKQKKNLVFLTLILAFVLGVVLRLYPVTYNQHLRDLNNAKLVAYVNLGNLIRQEIEKTYPNLTDQGKSELYLRRLQQVMGKNKGDIEKLIIQIAAQAAKNPQRQLYLLEADSYYYLGLTRNILRYGNIGGKVSSGLYFNPLMMAPLGGWYNFDLHPYVGFLVYKVIGVFDKHISLELAVALVPVLLFVLALFLFAWMLQALKFSPLAWAMGTVFFACFPVLIVRDSFGWYDTDIYNVIFPVLIVTSIIKSLEIKASFRNCVLWVFLSSLFSALYSLFWRGWIYLPLLVSLTYLIILVLNIFSRFFQREKKLYILPVFYLIWAFVFAALFIGIGGIKEAMVEASTLVRGFLNMKPNFWPDVFITIGELRPPEYSKTIESFGGIFICALAIVGFLYSLVSGLKIKPHSGGDKTMLFVIFFSIFLLIFAVSAERFLLFAIIPLGIFLAFGADVLLKAGRMVGERFKTIPRRILNICLTVMLVMIILSELRFAHIEASQQFPIMNDTWMKALLDIRDKTPVKSIVNSWWCPGHFITCLSQRRVTFDGATQNTPQGYWMARFFLSPNEKQALGILRMLNTSGNSAYDYLVQSGYKASQAIDILNSILSRSRKSAIDKLRQIMPQEAVIKLVGLTHGNPDPSYCMVYNDLIKSVTLLPYMGNWDVQRVEEFYELNKNNPAKIREVTKRGSEEYREFLWSISGGELCVEDEFYESQRTANRVFFPNGVSIDLDDLDCTLTKPEKKITAKPISVFYLDGDTFKEKRMPNPTAAVSVLLIKRGNVYSSVVADRQLCQSLIFRLYYLGGKGLEFLRLFSQDEDVMTQTRIFVYEVDWHKFLAQE